MQVNNDIIILFCGVVIIIALFTVIWTIYFYYKSVRFMSDRILARSLGEVKSFESDPEKGDAGLKIVFPADDETLALAEKNNKNKRIIQLREEERRLNKQMEKMKIEQG